MKIITPCLWFDNQAEEAAKFYTSIFPDSKIGKTMSYDKLMAEASGQMPGSVMMVEFELFGQKFIALNGGSAFKFSEAVSFVIECVDQPEIDHYWEKLSAGGSEWQCGWLKDKFGLSWQVVPKSLDDLLLTGGPKVTETMLKMKKIDLAELQQVAK